MSTPHLVATMQARLEYKRTGSMSSVYGATAEADPVAVMQYNINAEYPARGRIRAFGCRAWRLRSGLKGGRGEWCSWAAGEVGQG